VPARLNPDSWWYDFPSWWSVVEKKGHALALLIVSLNMPNEAFLVGNQQSNVKAPKGERDIS
jgi:hypothetical protein